VALRAGDTAAGAAPLDDAFARGEGLIMRDKFGPLGAAPRWRCGLLALLILAQLPSAQAAGPTGPTPYPEQLQDGPGQGWAPVFGWMTQNRKSFWAQRQAKQGAVVFVGDSLIGQWSSLMQDFPDLLVANRGIGGDTSRALLFRFGEDVMDLAPKAVVLLIGSNDLSSRQAVPVTVANIAQILDMVQTRKPGTPVILCTIAPRDHPKSRIDVRQLDLLNVALRSLAEQRPQVSLLDLHGLLAQPDGSVTPAYVREDRLHLSPDGYKQWQAALNARFSELGLR
jgi:lysophospholipase L1-like esterase